MRKIFCLGVFAALGVGLGLLIYSLVMVVQVQGSAMLPTMEPGDRLLVSRLSGGETVQVGDVIVYEAPYYTIDGEGATLVRRVTGSRGSWIRVDCDAPTTRDQEALVAAEDIKGKVILNFSNFHVTF